MFRRTLCLLCAVLLLANAVPALSEQAEGCGSYDFDLTFTLNADAFPELLRARASGYASLINRLGLRGNISWSAANNSADLEATLYFTDDPSLTYPFHLYGAPSRVFITSPLINNEIILLNMAALMEFAVKAKNTLGISLPYVALLVPYTTESAFSGMAEAWQDIIGTSKKSRKVSVKQFRELSARWKDEILNSNRLRIWITGLSSGSEAPAAVETEIESLPDYYETVTGSRPVSVSVSSGSETWKNAAGDTLFTRRESDGEASFVLSLPASRTGYIPYYSRAYQQDDQSFSFDIAASVRRDPSAASVIEEEYNEYASYDEESVSESYDEYEDDYDEYNGYGGYEEDLPEYLLDFHAGGTGIPRALPADAAFSLSVSVLGALYPNYGFRINGETKKDGSVTLSLEKPESSGASPVEIFRCSGSFLPAAEPKDVPDYHQDSLEGVFNVFSLNEQKLTNFTAKVITPLVKSVISFVAAAPTAACQSFLDDLTDMGILDMILD